MRKIKVENLKLLLVICLPLVFYIAVTLSVAHIHHSLCIFKFLTGHECWGCGMTRAFNALFHLQFTLAYSFNPRIIIVAPLMFVAWLQLLITAVRQKKVTLKVR